MDKSFYTYIKIVFESEKFKTGHFFTVSLILGVNADLNTLLCISIAIKSCVCNNLQVYAMLRSWRAQEGSLAQASVLARALRDCRMDDAVAVLLP